MSEARDAFERQMKETVLAGHRLAGIALGSKLNLFGSFGDEPMTSAELAEQANCKERYVLEWLRLMVLCDVIDVDESGTRFMLPGHRRDVLTDTSTLVGDPITLIFSYLLIPHKELVECFRTDGPNGLPFDAVRPSLDNYIEVDPKADAKTGDYIAENIKGLKDDLEAGVNVLEIGLGNGKLFFHLANKFPKSTFRGFDVSQEMLDQAGEKYKEMGSLPNASLALHDITKLPSEFSNTFQFIYMRDVLHDVAFPSRALEEVYRCLKPGGTLLLMEYSMKDNVYDAKKDANLKVNGQLLYLSSLYHCLPFSMNTEGSQALGTCPGETKLMTLMTEAGLGVDEAEMYVYRDVHCHIVGRKPSGK